MIGTSLRVVPDTQLRLLDATLGTIATSPVWGTHRPLLVDEVDRLLDKRLALVADTGADT